jgi:hypothetical protein
MSAEEPIERRKYWVRFYYGECPACGRTQNYRERVYCDVQPKPENPRLRHVQLLDLESYDGCAY